MGDQVFIEFVGESLLSLPQDLQTVLRIVEDSDFDDESRVDAAGSILYTLSSANAIPGLTGLLAFFDDVALLRLVLERIEKRSPEAFKEHVDDAPELLGELPAQMALIRKNLSAWMPMLEKAADGVGKTNHHGHAARKCALDREGIDWLYDTIQEALVNELEFVEDDVLRAAKTVEQVLAQLRAPK